VQLAGVDAELGDHPEHQLSEQAGTVGVEEPFQRPAHPIVVDLPGVDPPAGAGREPQRGRLVAGGPLAQPVERLAAGQQVAHDQLDRGGRGESVARVVGR
jgi:hypothetical protein